MTLKKAHDVKIEAVVVKARTFFDIDFRQAEKHFLCYYLYADWLNNGLKSFSLCFKWFFFVYVDYTSVVCVDIILLCECFQIQCGGDYNWVCLKKVWKLFLILFFSVWWRWWGTQDVCNSVNENENVYQQ